MRRVHSDFVVHRCRNGVSTDTALRMNEMNERGRVEGNRSAIYAGWPPSPEQTAYKSRGYVEVHRRP